MQVVHLLRAEHGAALVVGVADVDELGRLVAVGAQVQHDDLGQRAVAERTVQVAALRERGGADRQPLQVRLDGGVAAGHVVALGGGVVVLGAGGVVVVGHLVVVPGHQPRFGGVGGLQVGVGAVVAVAAAVVGQRDDLVRRLVVADGAALPGVFAARVLVDVVADAHDHVDVGVVRHVAVGGEVAGFPVGAGGQGDAELVGRGSRGRGGAGAADRGDLAGEFALGDGEAVAVPGVGGQAGRVELDGVVCGGVGDGLARQDDGAEGIVRGHLAQELDDGAGARAGNVSRMGGGAGPQEDGIRQRVARGDAMLEHGVPAGVDRALRGLLGRSAEAAGQPGGADEGGTGGARLEHGSAGRGRRGGR